MLLWRRPLRNIGSRDSPRQKSRASHSTLVTHTDEGQEEDRTEFVVREEGFKRNGELSHRKRQEPSRPDASFKRLRRKSRINPSSTPPERRRRDEPMSRYRGVVPPSMSRYFRAVPLSMSRYHEHDASEFLQNDRPVSDKIAVAERMRGAEGIVQNARKLVYNRGGVPKSPD